MRKHIKWLFYVAIILTVFNACQKPDLIEKNDAQSASAEVTYSMEDGGRYQQILEFLDAKKAASSSYDAAKIDSLIADMSELVSMVIPFSENIEVVVCDLKEYVNQSIPAYERTHYKLYFEFKDGVVMGGEIYTAHTNLTKQELDSDFENIFLNQSEGFSGTIVINKLNDEFSQQLVFNNGQLETESVLSLTAEDGSSASLVQTALHTTS